MKKGDIIIDDMHRIGMIYEVGTGYLIVRYRYGELLRCDMDWVETLVASEQFESEDEKETFISVYETMHPEERDDYDEWPFYEDELDYDDDETW